MTERRRTHAQRGGSVLRAVGVRPSSWNTLGGFVQAHLIYETHEGGLPVDCLNRRNVSLGAHNGADPAVGTPVKPDELAGSPRFLAFGGHRLRGLDGLQHAVTVPEPNIPFPRLDWIAAVVNYKVEHGFLLQGSEDKSTIRAFG